MQNKNLKIAIIGAMDCEVEKLTLLLENIKKINHGKLVIYEGKIGEHDVYVSKSGVGKVNAALNTQYLIDKYAPDYIINTGIAGGVGLNLSVGDIVIGTDLVQYDFDASALGYAKGYMCTGHNSDKPTLYIADEFLINKFEESLSGVAKDFKIHKGRIATGDMFVGTTEKKTEIRELFNASAVEMEGAAIAQTAFCNSIPFLIIRAISDLADCTAQKSLEEVETKMAQFASSTIEKLLKSI